MRALEWKTRSRKEKPRTKCDFCSKFPSRSDTLPILYLQFITKNVCRQHGREDFFVFFYKNNIEIHILYKNFMMRADAHPLPPSHGGGNGLRMRGSFDRFAPRDDADAPPPSVTAQPCHPPPQRGVGPDARPTEGARAKRVILRDVHSVIASS